jgi:hypothetical protein
MKNKIVKSLGAIVFTLLIILNAIPAIRLFVSAGEIKANLQSEIDAIQVDPEFSLKDSYSLDDSSTLTRGMSFKTSQNYKDSRDYWLGAFTKAGWNLNKEREIEIFGHKVGEKTIDFVKNDYHATLDFELTGEDRIKKVNLDVRWEMYWQIRNFLFLFILIDLGLIGLGWLINGGKKRNKTSRVRNTKNQYLERFTNTKFYHVAIRAVGAFLFIFAIFSTYLWITLFA